MRKEDWIGLTASLVLHGLLALAFFFISAAPQSLSAGFVEVEFGAISTGRPVQRALEEEMMEPPDEEQLEEDRIRPSDESVEEGRLVDLPDQRALPEDDEVVRSPETERLGAEQASTAAQTSVEGDARMQRDAREGGDTQGNAGATSGDEGTGVEEEKSSPYQLEGLEDRTLRREVLPRYTKKVNAVIQMRISVDPRGQVSRIIPLMKSDPELERAVMDALRTWRFSPLRPNVPQENQMGVVTFRFRLE